MQAEKLQRAIGAIHVRFGGQALVQANRLPPTEPWPTGQPAVDRLSGIGGLPRGRVSVLQGTPGSGKLSLALALLARASREHARAVVIDGHGGFDPWIADRLGADLGAITVVRSTTPAAAGEAAVALARAGAGFGLVLDALPEAALAPLESAAARSGCLVVVVAEARAWAGEASEERRALAHASSLTLELGHLGWVRGPDMVTGARTMVRCVKNRLGAPGAEAELEVRYPLGPGQPAAEEPREVAPAGEPSQPVVELCRDESAAG
jgi:recombination protein RecA